MPSTQSVSSNLWKSYADHTTKPTLKNPGKEGEGNLLIMCYKFSTTLKGMFDEMLNIASRDSDENKKKQKGASNQLKRSQETSAESFKQQRTLSTLNVLAFGASFIAKSITPSHSSLQVAHQQGLQLVNNNPVWTTSHKVNLGSEITHDLADKFFKSIIDTHGQEKSTKDQATIESKRSETELLKGVGSEIAATKQGVQSDAGGFKNSVPQLFDKASGLFTAGCRK